MSSHSIKSDLSFARQAAPFQWNVWFFTILWQVRGHWSCHVVLFPAYGSNLLEQRAPVSHNGCGEVLSGNHLAPQCAALHMTPRSKSAPPSLPWLNLKKTLHSITTSKTLQFAGTAHQHSGKPRWWLSALLLLLLLLLRLCENCTFLPRHFIMPSASMYFGSSCMAQARYFGISRGERRFWACGTWETYFRVASHLVCSVVSEPATFAWQAELQRAQGTLVEQWPLNLESLTLQGRFVVRCPRLSLEHVQIGKNGVGTACLMQRWKLCWMT